MNAPVSNAKIVTSDDTLKVERTVALQDLNEGMNNGLQKLVSDFEATANEPVRLDPGPPPLALTLGDLRQTEEAQSNALQRIADIVQQSEADAAAVNRDLKADLIAEQVRKIKQQALEKASGFYREMAGRSEKAKATREFYQPAAVFRRARFDGSEQAHHAAVAAWTVRLSAAPGVALIGFAREAVASGNVALAALVLENAQGREGQVSDAVRHGVEGVVATLELRESREGLGLVDSIILSEAKANIEMQKLNSGRLDALSKSGRDKISAGLYERGRRGRGALVN